VRPGPGGGRAGLYLYAVTGKIGVVMAFTGAMVSRSITTATWFH